MAYRKSDAEILRLARLREMIFKTASDMMARHGREGLTSYSLALKIEWSTSRLFKHFGSFDDLLAEMATRARDIDVSAMRVAVTPEMTGPNALAASLTALYHRFNRPRLTLGLLTLPLYRLGILGEIEESIRVTIGMTPKARSLAAVAILGALAFAAGEPKNAPEVVLMALRAIGIADGVARRAAKV